MSFPTEKSFLHKAFSKSDILDSDQAQRVFFPAHSVQTDRRTHAEHQALAAFTC